MIEIPVEPAITDYLHRKATYMRIPLNGTFEITPVCNMDCKMCYVRMSHAQQQAVRPLRTADEWLALAQEAKDTGMLYLLVTGGEPFLHPQCREIISGLQKMGFVLSINSNGTMIDEHVISWLKETPPTRINITLYGASDETYAALCGNPKGFTQVTRAIRLLRDAGISVKLNCSVTPYNAKDLAQMLKFAEDNRLIIQPTTYMFPPLRKDASMIGRNDRFTPEEAAYYSAKIEYLLGGHDRFFDRADDDLPPLSGEIDENCEGTGEGIRCRAGKCTFWVTWEGKLMPCGMIPSPVEGNVFEDGFLPSWQNAMKIVDCIRLPVQCASCKLKDSCRACAAMVYTETGSFDQVPEYRCRMAHSLRSQRDKFKAEVIAQMADGE